MDRVTTSTTRVDESSHQWTAYCDREQLLITLREAAARAAVQGRDVLASFTQPIKWCDPLRIFAALQQMGLETCFFLERPIEQCSLVGAGAVLSLEIGGI